MTDNLTPTAQATLEALGGGPATAGELRERTGRSRSATDKALTELAKAALAVKVDPQDSADGSAARWALATDAAPDDDTTTDDDQAPCSDTTDDAAPAPEPAISGPTDQSATCDEDPRPDGEQHSDDETNSDDEQHDDVHSDDDADDGHDRTGEDGHLPDTHQPLDDPDADGTGISPPQDRSPGEDQPDQPETDEAATAEPATDEVKICRGCQNQMPLVCPCCRQKTGAYCGTCRKDLPAARRRTPGQPEILSNGLPKLTHGELQRLVLDVMRTQPLPEHLGITGWTSGRVAVFLPGRSTGAIGNVLDKLAATGQAHQLGEAPKRYQLTPDTQPGDGEQPAPEQPDIEAVPGGHATGQPDADRPNDADPQDDADRQDEDTAVKGPRSTE